MWTKQIFCVSNCSPKQGFTELKNLLIYNIYDNNCFHQSRKEKEISKASHDLQYFISKCCFITRCFRIIIPYDLILMQCRIHYYFIPIKQKSKLRLCSVRSLGPITNLNALFGILQMHLSHRCVAHTLAIILRDWAVQVAAQ